MRSKKILPVHALKMASLLKNKKSRREIARIMHNDHGLNQDTVRHFLRLKLSLQDIKKDGVDAVLWNYRESIKSREEKWEIRSRASKKRAQTIGKEGLKAISKKRGPDPFKEARDALMKITSEEWSQIAKKRERNMSLEAKRKRAETRVQTLGSKGLSKVARKINKTLGSEGRSARTTKGWKTKHKKLYADFEYLEDLPERNLLSRDEKKRLFEEHLDLVDSLIERFKGRKDLDDVKQVALLGFSIALVKWDKKMDLKKLITDYIELGLINYFAAEKKYKRPFISEADAEIEGLKWERLRGI